MLQKGLHQISPSKEVTHGHRRIVLQNTLQLQVVTGVFIDETSCVVLIMDETEGQGVKHAAAAAGNTSPQGATTQTFKSQTHCLCSSGLHDVTCVTCCKLRCSTSTHLQEVKTSNILSKCSFTCHLKKHVFIILRMLAVRIWVFKCLLA